MAFSFELFSYSVSSMFTSCNTLPETSLFTISFFSYYLLIFSSASICAYRFPVLIFFAINSSMNELKMVIIGLALALNLSAYFYKRSLLRSIKNIWRPSMPSSTTKLLIFFKSIMMSRIKVRSSVYLKRLRSIFFDSSTSRSINFFRVLMNLSIYASCSYLNSS